MKNNMCNDTFEKGAAVMMKEAEQYKAEAKEKWGDTAAYREYEQKAERRSDSEYIEAGEHMGKIFAEIGKLRNLAPDDEAVQKKIAELQKFITDNFYTCTNEILASLGLMYVADERFKGNIDNAGGEGTAELVSRAIEIYCAK